MLSHPDDNWISQTNELFPLFRAGWNYREERDTNLLSGKIEAVSTVTVA